MSMIKNLVLGCLVSLIPLLSFPQGKKMNIQEALAKYGAKAFRGVPHLDEFSPLWWGKSEVETVDSSRLEVVYDLKYRRAHRVGNYWEMLTILQVGTVWQKYYSMIRQFTDDIQREVSGVAKGIAPAPGVGYEHQYTEEELHIKEIAGKDFMNCEIWVERPIRRLTERAHAFDKANVSIEYEEPVPMIEWQLTEKTDTIAGCVCFLATTHFRGRDWNVWFDPTIPINSGPWKLNGLPGLVLKAEDAEQDYIWTCQSITQERKPIVYYKVKQQLMTRQKWQRYFRQVHEDPVTILGDGGNYLFFHGINLIQKEDNWTLPYNPIELE